MDGLRSAPLGTAAQLALTLVVGVLPALSAWFGKLLLDELARGGGADGHAVLVAAVGGAGLGVLAAVGVRVVTVLAQRNRLAASAALEARLFTRVNDLVSLRHFDDPHHHDRLTLAQQSVAEVPGQVCGLAADVVRTAATVGGFLVVVVHIWPPLLMLVGVSTVLALWAESRLARVQAAATLAVAPSRRRHALLQLLMVNPSAAKEIRLYGLGPFFHARMMRALHERNRVELMVSRRDAVVQSAFLIAAGIITAVGTVAVAGRVGAGQASVGDVGFLVAAVAGLQSGVSGVIEGFGRASRALRLFNHLVALETSAGDMPRGRRPVPALRAGIELRDVWFRYDPAQPWILRGVSFTVPFGRSVALVGLNGAGKSTLAKLLCRFYDPGHGQILWDGVDLRELDVEQLRARIAATYQEPMTFDLVARESIGIGELAAVDDLARVRAAARLAGIDDVLAGLPRGYETMLSSFVHDDEAGDGAGVLLSGGQWQRVAVARSLMRASSDLLILDEPSTGLDPLAEHRIHAMLQRQRQGRTTLMISHRLSALREADQIVVLSGGVVTEHGDHRGLVAAGGGYARLFAVQAAGYRDDPGPPGARAAGAVARGRG